MSVLSFPRLHLRGGMSWDPVVSNNDPAVYDGVAARAMLAPGERVACFRERMIASTVERGDWNYFGTYRCALEGGQVSGGSLAPRDGGDLLGDGVLGAPVGLVGKLVDIDPAGVLSQLFFDELTVGVPGRPHLRARPRRRMSSRWLNFGRNLGELPIAGRASAAWQTVFPTADVELRRTGGSPLLGRLAAALDQPRARGLVLRLSTYRTLYFQNGVLNELEPAADLGQLQRLHERGLPVSNPAYSLVVGTLGVWWDGESESVPDGRRLFSAGPVPVRNAGGRPAAAGPAAAVFHPDEGTLSLDLADTVPELDRDAEKADFGPLEVVVETDDGAVGIGRVEYSAYDRSAYEARAGVVDVDVSGRPDVAALLSRGRLSIRVDAPAGCTELLGERRLTASCDDCNVYLDQDELRTLAIRARECGEPPSRPLSVLVATYVQAEDIVFSGEMTVLPVAEDGTATLEIRGEQPGYRHLGFTVFGEGDIPVPPATLPIATADFTSVRTLPFDDELADATPDEALTFGFVFANVLSTYDAIAPRMSNVLDLSSAEAVRTFARRILEVVDPALFESSRYMPVTRDLSRGGRTLLRRFCTLQLTSPGPARVPAPEPPTAAEAGADRADGRGEPGPSGPGGLRTAPLGEPFDKRALPG
ncbi:hypothetical protein ACU610_09615 [Geodermatophilus sp. URMC 61]|uniref:hypothetical protein n=1 Tax=Geodermatophilus sp. URMC 61 TaxID=3423411 RepID=UPI00406CADFE